MCLWPGLFQALVLSFFIWNMRSGWVMGWDQARSQGPSGSDGQSVFSALFWGLLGGTVRHLDCSEWYGSSLGRENSLPKSASLVTVGPVPSGTWGLSGLGWGWVPGQIGALGSGPPRERYPYVNDRMRDSISGCILPPSPSPASFNHLSQEFQICRWLLLKLVHKVPYPILSEYAVL